MKRELKVCPIQSDVKTDVNCLEEKCAWWNSLFSRCAIACIGGAAAMQMAHADAFLKFHGARIEQMNAKEEKNG